MFTILKYLINYANKKYQKTQKFNSWTGKYIAKFDKVLEYTPQDLDEEFKEINKEILSIKRGAGLWLWKPYIICKTLEIMNEGDILFYCDSGSFFIKNIDLLIKSMGNDYIWVQDIPLIVKQYTKKETLILMEANYDEIKEKNQIQSGFILARKCIQSITFFKDWLNLCCDIRILYGHTKMKEDSYFISHREDQSILSVLCHKIGIKAHKDPTQFGVYPDLYYYIDKVIYKPKTNYNDNYKMVIFLHRQMKIKISIIIKALLFFLFPYKIMSAIIKKRVMYKRKKLKDSKNIIQINGSAGGCTGRIANQILSLAEKEGYSKYIFVPNIINQRRYNLKHKRYIGTMFEAKLHYYLHLYFGKNETRSKWATKRFIKRLQKLKPEIIHLHNLHDYYINIKILFDYIKKNNIKTIWTLHDCWSFTGQCPHFQIANCEKWKTGCFNCPQIHEYPASRVDKTKEMWLLKKECFTGVKDLTIITPSQWLADIVKQSFLNDYIIKVINNGIDLTVFKPLKSDFKKIYNVKNKYILLGVAGCWGVKKGLDIFIELSKRLRDEYQVVLVGTDDEIKKQLPKNIIAINRTENQHQLAEIYTAADVFINPTREEVFGMVNVEALACGTPVIMFDTGGSPEIIDQTCGIIVPRDNIDVMIEKLYYIIDNPIPTDFCIKRAKLFSENEKFKEYIKVYKNIEF